MTNGDRIAASVLAAMNGTLEVYDEGAGKCGRVTRQLLMHALGLSYEEYYALFRQVAVDGRPLSAPGQPDFDPWARDTMRTLRDVLGWRAAYSDDVPVIYHDLLPGDIICSWELGKPQGHIAVLLTGGVNAVAFENTGQLRGEHIRGFDRLTRVDTLTLLEPGTWQVFRVPDELPNIPQQPGEGPGFDPEGRDTFLAQQAEAGEA